MMRPNQRIIWILAFTTIATFKAHSQSFGDSTVFNFGGYVKADFINTWYNNGDVGSTSPLRDFHLPSQIPVGLRDVNRNLDYHVKESRFNFDVSSKVGGQRIHGFLELDFLLSGQGDEKVSNSFNPRLRHFYFEWKRLLIGQTWMTFMIVVIPDDLDFTGALDGIVAGRQPMIRYKAGDWWFAIENPETTVIGFQQETVTVTEKELNPDVVVRRNFGGDWGTWAVAGMWRTLAGKDSTNAVRKANGFGLTTGGKIKVGKRGDDIRAMATYGHGLGRYLAANFIAAGVLDQQNEINPINSLNGYIAWNHYWIPEKVSSSFNVAAFEAFNDNDLVGTGANERSYSASVNLKYTPVKQMLFGIEYMHAYRELNSGVNGSMDRIQISAKYWFGYKNLAVYEKN